MHLITQIAAITEDDWRVEGACRDEPAEDWFPELARSRAAREAIEATTAKAKAVCRGCPVRAECLRHALETPERWGLWGGLTARERLNLKRRHA